MTPCVAYTRVSSDEQAKVGYSIAFQRARLDQYATERGFKVVAWFEDVDSAKQTGRPGFARLLRHLEQHADVRDVIVHRVDRLIRNHYEYGLVVEQLGARVHSVVEPAEDSAAGRMLHGVNVVVAKYHSDNLSQEVRKGMLGKFEAGGCVTHAPVGYKNVTRTRTERSYVVVDPGRAPLVRLLFERYSTGFYSYRTLASELFDAGLRTRSGKVFPAERIRRILRHPFYKGVVVYRGQERPGLHEPIVDPELWERVQRVATRRTRDTGEKGRKFFLLRGLVTCASCGHRMTAENHRRGSYYRCLPDRSGARCPAPYAPVAELDQAVAVLLRRVSLTKVHQAGILSALDQVDAERAGIRRREEQGLVARREKLEARLHQLTECLADGTLPRDEYRRFRAEYEHEGRAISERLAFLTRDLSDDIESLKRVVEQAGALHTLFEAAATDDDRKDLLRQVFARITVKDRNIEHIEYHPPFRLLVEDTRKGSRKSIAQGLVDHLMDQNEE